jgi:hypothetical protein
MDKLSTLERDRSRLRVIHVLSDSTGAFPDSKSSFPKGKELLWLLSHEICHAHETEPNWPLRLIDPDRIHEWERAVAAQLRSGPVSWYPMLSLVGNNVIGGMKTQDPEEISELAVHPEFVSEHFAAWVTGGKRDLHEGLIHWEAQPLCSQMTRFFEKYVPKTFD